MFVATFAAYAWTASPAVGWLDSPEFVATGASLGVAHSPGHPLAGLLGRLATLVPVGDMAFRVNLMSALCGALAALAVYCAARALIARVAPSFEESSSAVAAAAVALAVALSWSAWFQSVRAEVYALEAGLLGGALAAVLAWDRDREARWLMLAGLLCGLGLAHHHLMTLLFLVPAGAFALLRTRRDRPSLRVAAATALCGVVGLAALVYLPARAAADPEVNWGDPQTFDRFTWTLTAEAFHKSAGAEHASSAGEDAAQIVAALIEQSTPLLFVAALLGMYLGLRRAGHRRLVGLLVGVAALSVAARVSLGFDPDTPDHHSYLWPALVAVALLGVAGLAQLAHLVAGESRGVVAVLAAVVVAGVVPWQVARNASAARLDDAYASDALARAELEALPPRTVVLVGYFQTSFRIWALRAMDEARPDVVALERSFMTYPGFAEVARARHPELASIIDAPLRAGAPTPVDALRALHRPVAVQLHVNLDEAPKSALIPRGVYAWLQPARATAEQRDAAEPLDAAERDRLDATLAGAVAGDAAGIRDNLLWLDFLRLDFYCDMGRRGAATRALDRAARAAPGDETLAERAQACGIAHN